MIEMNISLPVPGLIDDFTGSLSTLQPRLSDRREAWPVINSLKVRLQRGLHAHIIHRAGLLTILKAGTSEELTARESTERKLCGPQMETT